MAKKNNIKYLKIFFLFLKKNKIYGSYKRELSFHPISNTFPFNTIEALIEGFSPPELINRAFSWCYSKNGWFFWQDMNAKWLNELKKF